MLRAGAAADAGDQALWQLQAPDVFSGREPAARARQGCRLCREDSHLERRSARRGGAEQGLETRAPLGRRAQGGVVGDVGRVPEVIGMTDDVTRLTKVRPAG